MRSRIAFTSGYAGQRDGGAEGRTLALADTRCRRHRHGEFPRRRGPRGSDLAHGQLCNLSLGGTGRRIGLIEGISEGLAGAGRFVGGALADDPLRRRAVAVGGYSATAVLSALIGATTSVVQAGVLRGAAWTARGLRVPARNTLLADVVPTKVYGRAYGFERTMDNLGAIVGPLLALALVSMFSVRTAILEFPQQWDRLFSDVDAFAVVRSRVAIHAR
jgi:sugar phosphate permease